MCLATCLAKGDTSRACLPPVGEPGGGSLRHRPTRAVRRPHTGRASPAPSAFEPASSPGPPHPPRSGPTRQLPPMTRHPPAGPRRPSPSGEAVRVSRDRTVRRSVIIRHRDEWCDFRAAHVALGTRMIRRLAGVSRRTPPVRRQRIVATPSLLDELPRRASKADAAPRRMGARYSNAARGSNADAKKPAAQSDPPRKPARCGVFGAESRRRAGWSGASTKAVRSALAG